jgi:hypothetical protein
MVDCVHKIAAAPLRTLSDVATRFCTPYSLSDAVALNIEKFFGWIAPTDKVHRAIGAAAAR